MWKPTLIPTAVLLDFSRLISAQDPSMMNVILEGVTITDFVTRTVVGVGIAWMVSTFEVQRMSNEPVLSCIR